MSTAIGATGRFGVTANPLGATCAWWGKAEDAKRAAAAAHPTGPWLRPPKGSASGSADRIAALQEALRRAQDAGTPRPDTPGAPLAPCLNTFQSWVVVKGLPWWRH